MKKLFYVAAIISVYNLLFPSIAYGQEYIDLCTFNIYKRTTDDDEHAWSTRQVLVKNIISEYNFDMLGTQESDRTQVNDILTLGGYKDYGIGMHTGLQSTGWRNAIIYKSNRFQIVDSGVFWFSETPAILSKGWDADQNRNCNWAKILDNNTGKYFFYFCAHFDHLGTLARINSAKMICDTLPEIAGDYPAFFMGDLNATETSEPILLLNKGLHDSRELSLTTPKGPYGTGHGWRIDVNVRRIDYIYTYNGNGRNRIEVQEYEVIDKTYDGKAPSDHWPVRIKARLVAGVATYTVTSKLDDGGEKTLRTILSQALAGDSITINNTSVDTIKLNSPITINKNIRINGNGVVIQVLHPGSSAFRVFTLGANSETTDSLSITNMKLHGGNVSGLISTNGNGGVILINKNIHLKMNQVELSKGKAVYGGAVFCVDTLGVSIEMNNCRFADNTSTNNAGAIYLKAISGKLNNCVFDNNISERNGSAVVSNKHAEISNSTFKNNSSITSVSTDYGAAIFNSGGGYMQILNSTFDSNTTLQYGTGAFACSGTGTNTILTNVTFWNNSGKISSALYNRTGNMELIHCTVAGNKTQADNGAAYYAYPVPEATNRFTNSILAFNYNQTGKQDIQIGGGAIVSGTNNIVGIQSGAENLSNTLSFNYATDTQNESILFSDYINTVFNSAVIKQPVLAAHGGQTQTIAIGESSIAYRAGAYGLPDVVLPAYDQRNYTRYGHPCIGAYEAICDFPENPSAKEVKSESAVLSWHGSTGNYQVAYKPQGTINWLTAETNENNIQLSGLFPSTTYEWKLRSVCTSDFPGEWIYGAAFTTPFRLVVTSPLDDGGSETLRYIVNNAQPGDSILIAVDTITLSNVIELKRHIHINGQGATIRPVTITGSKHRIFTLGADLATTDSIGLYNLNLYGGDLTLNASTEANGGILFIYKNVHLSAENIIFKSGKASYGGAIHCNDSTGTRIYMNNCSFLNNESVNNAGAFYVKAICELKNCIFDGNKTGSNGSALTTVHQLKINQTIFKNNSAVGSGAYGGAIFNTNGGTLLVENSTFDSNIALTSGAGAFGCSTGTTSSYFVNSTFHGNSGATASVFYNRAGTINLINCTVSGNIANATNAAAYLNYNATNATANFINNIFTYNYNVTSPYDVNFEATSVANGTNNLIAVINQYQGIQNTITFNYGSISGNDPELFADYTFDGTRKIPVLQSNGGPTKTIALSNTQSMAYAAGVDSYVGFGMPLYDQREIERTNPPCLGSYELSSETGVISNRDILKNYCLYPNPAKDYLNIKVSATFIKAELYTLSGLKIVSYHSQHCNLRNLNAGIYLLRIFTDQGTVTDKVIIY